MARKLSGFAGFRSGVRKYAARSDQWEGNIRDPTGLRVGQIYSQKEETILKMLRIVLLVFLSLSPSTAQQAAPLDSTDFVIAGIRDGMDSVTIIKVLGPPKSIILSDHPYDSTTKLFNWEYEGVTVHSGSENSVSGVSVTSRRFPSKRGIRVGDSDKLVLRRYGKPDNEYENQGHWNFLDPKNEMHAVKFYIQHAKVIGIYVGWFLD
jgi:hypothetical protein